MASRPKRITSISFAQALAAAGLLDDLNRVARLTIVADPANVVMMNVEYFGDERLLDLLAAAAEEAPAEETPGE